MTDEQINAAIAEACGWKEITNCTCGGKKRGCPPGSHTSSHVQNYCADLNAMHEAEETLTEEQWDVMFQYLISIRWEDASEDERRGIGLQKALSPSRAKANQRAEAFLRTIGKWEEAK